MASGKALPCAAIPVATARSVWNHPGTPGRVWCKHCFMGWHSGVFLSGMCKVLEFWASICSVESRGFRGTVAALTPSPHWEPCPTERRAVAYTYYTLDTWLMGMLRRRRADSAGPWICPRFCCAVRALPDFVDMAVSTLSRPSTQACPQPLHRSLRHAAIAFPTTSPPPSKTYLGLWLYSRRAPWALLCRYQTCRLARRAVCAGLSTYAMLHDIR